MSTSLIERPVQRSEAGMAIAVYAGFVLTGVVTTLLGPVLPALTAHWSLTDAQAGRLFTAQFVGSILGVGCTSWLLPKSGYRVALCAGYLLMATGIAGLGLSAWPLGMLCVFCYGTGMGLAIPASNLLVSEWNPQRRASAVSLLNFAWSIGAVACPFLIAMANLTDSLWEWLLGLAAALALTALGLGLQPATASQPGNDLPADANPVVWSKMFACVLGLLFFLYVGTETTLGGWVALHAKRTGASTSQMWVFTPSLFWGSVLLGRALAPVFLKWLPEKKLVLLDLAVATAGIVVLLEAGSVAGISVGGCIAGFGFASVFPINVSLLSAFASLASRAAGPMFALGSLGGAILPWLVGLIATRSGSLRLALVVPLVATLIMLALHGWNAVHRICLEDLHEKP